MTQMWIEILQQPEALKNCINTNKEKIKTLVEFLKNKDIRHIIISGRGTSWHSGIYFKYLMESKQNTGFLCSALGCYTLQWQSKHGRGIGNRYFPVRPRG